MRRSVWWWVVLGVAITAWTLLVVGTAASLWIEREMGDLGCEYSSGSSLYGDYRWSNWPIGGVCTYDFSWLDVHETKTLEWDLTIFLLALAASGSVLSVLAVIEFRRARSSRSTSWRPHVNIR